MATMTQQNGQLTTARKVQLFDLAHQVKNIYDTNYSRKAVMKLERTIKNPIERAFYTHVLFSI